MNKTKKRLVPELRFPEFTNQTEWSEKIIENFTKAESSSVAFNKLELKDEGYPVYGADSIVGYIDHYQHKEEYISIVKDGSGVGRLNLCKKESTILGTLISLKSNDNVQYNINWMYYLLNTIDFSSYIKGGGIPHIYYSDYKNEKVLVPNPSEQLKIADCLTSLDDVIAAHTDKLENLKHYKKGLIQNLFPQEGETVPKLRFKEFEKDEKWVETDVEENCLVKGRIGYRGYTTEDLVSQGEGALVLGGKHIQNQLLELKDPTYLSWDKYYESPEIMVEIGDIIFSQRGTLGDCAIIDKEIGPATINPSMVLLKNISCDARFLYYILIGDRIQGEVKKNMSMGAIPMLSQKQIKEFPFLIPMNLKEQQKIALLLSSVDDLIQAETNTIEQLKTHKKGLLQGLFPKIES
ncbi:restriction endonuclease subunit S [Flavobacterium sp.]|uniref:restriction endonuclease subunit S n=1 Tax=Flavobacterium sp. TaxID=239 RepID=UPI002B4B86BB|nr:restriction endonuclease subunit S [Flavobacterium sp.]HLP64750.1 restriction endonuclease subunit S [Flavobacterium sp.]